MKKTEKLKLATYNIQFSQNPKEVTRNLLTMASMGVNLFCLQEVTQTPSNIFILDVLLDALGDKWKAIYTIGKEKFPLGMGNCIIWNTEILNLEREKVVLLPKCKAFSPHEKFFSQIAGNVTVPFQRRVIIGDFTFNNVHIRISNIHLDHNGGIENRRRQLSYLMNCLRSEDVINYEILCGDFNSFDLRNNGKEAKMHIEILGSYFVDASKNSGWTADLHNIDIKYGGKFFTFLIKRMDFHIRRKLDYIWTRNVESSECKRLILDGSDHYPLIIALSL